MNASDKSGMSRRELGKLVGHAAVATALAGVAVPSVYAAGESTIQVALVGCGGRGSGAAGDALRTKGVQIKLIALADVFRDRMDSSYAGLAGRADIAHQIDVPADRKFIGFDAYKKAMDCLKPGDVVILATPLAFRWVHFAYAIEKGLNVFMEKPLSADGAASRRMLKLADDAAAKNLKVAVGLMSRHARPLQELQKRISDGAVGDIILMRGYRMSGPVATFQSTPKPSNMSDLEYQIRRFHSFLWAGGGCFSDYNIHIIDHLCWMKNAWPINASAVGGRHYKFDTDGKPFVDQNFDSYGVEYTFADGTKLMFDGRCIDGAAGEYYSYVHGTKGFAVASKSGDCGSPSSIYKGTAEVKSNKLWQSEKVDGYQPYHNEWDDFVDAIVDDKSYNEVKRGVQASVVTSMGRMAAHTGQIIAYDQMLNSAHEFAPGIDKITADSPGPLPSDSKGFYPKPEPGRKTREY